MKRLFEEMALADLPEPVLRQTDSGFIVTLYNRSHLGTDEINRLLDILPPAFHGVLDRLVVRGRITTGEAAELSGVSQPTVRRYFAALERTALVIRVSSSPTDPQAYWRSGPELETVWRSHQAANETVIENGAGDPSIQAASDFVSDRFVPVLHSLFRRGQFSTGEAAALSGLSAATVRRYFGILEREGMVERVERSPKDPHGFWGLRTQRSNSKSAIDM